MRTKLVVLSICALLSVTSIILLYSFSYKINHQKNGFNRIFKNGNQRIKLISALDLKFNSYYFAGLSNNHIYLGNSTATSRLLITDYSLKDMHTTILRSPDTNKIAWKALRVFVDSPNIYMVEGILPSALHVDINSLNSVRYNLKINEFNASVPLSTNQFVYRSYDRNSKQNVLLKEKLNGDLIKYSNILEKQQDGVFSTDGMFFYNKVLGQLVYVYYYRNQFICLDSNLSIQFKGNTIDTVEHAHIKVSTLSENGKITLSSPPLFVNKTFCTNNKGIFINSNLTSDNEPKQLYSVNSAIDVYSTKNGNYLFSFYIPIYKNKKMTEFRVQNDLIFALNDRYLLVYKFNLL